MADQGNWRRRMSATSSWTVLGLLLACGAGEALAQTASAGGGQAATAVPPPTDPNATTPAELTPSGTTEAAPPETDVTDAGEEIVVTGSRASQQSANSRKKNARTATDSIVADDIGSFPDRNVNEAISRIPGVALERNSFGEGESVAVRGNGPDLTRVELDGIGVQSTNPLGSGRGADLRELPAEIVKSVDVVKGSTADMTEGSLGGTVQIRTRTGLDFRGPYFSVRAGASQNSLGRDWTPDFNAVAASRFLDDRLGLIVSGTYAKIQNNGHAYETTTSGNRGYARLFDFDQSPEKTFTFNSATVGTDAADVPFANSTGPNGRPLTPRELVTLAAGAQSKAQCFQIFPHNPAASPAQRSQRILEQQSCLNQWNDYTPSLIRHFMNTQTDQRYSIDARADYRLTDNLTVFVKGTMANRKVHDQFRSRTPITLFGQNVPGTFEVSTTGYPRRRTVSDLAPPGFALFDPNFGLNNFGNNATLGNVLNVVPGSVKVDAAHNVTEMTLTNNFVSIDQIENQIDTKTYYAQTGAEYRSERLEIDFMAGLTRADSRRGDMRTGRFYQYGDATLTLQRNGLFDIDLPADYDESNPANFVQLSPARCLNVAGAPRTPPNCIGQTAQPASEFNPSPSPAFTVGQLPLTTPSFGVSFSPALGENSEKIAKLDAAYKTDEILPFFTRFKVGAMYRNNELARFGGGGYTVRAAQGTFGQPGFVPGIHVPRALVRGQLRACQPTPGSSAPGGLSCNFGFVQSDDPRFSREGVDTLTPEALRDLFARTTEPADSKFFGDLPNRGNLPPAFNGIRTDKLFAALGASQFMNFDCVKQCTGSDGQVYDQPVTRADETIKNVYAMFDFEQRLPLGLLFNGNVGVRAIFANTKATGLQTLRAVRVGPNFDPQRPNANIVAQTFSKIVTVDSNLTDWLPSANFNLWGFDESLVLRLYGGKTVARPSINTLIPGGTCTVLDEREALGADNELFECGGRVGNPDLKPFTAWSYNASVEWYPNRDTLFSATYGRLDVKIGNPIGVTETARPFEGSTDTDPLTGQPLSELEFTFPTFANGPGFTRDIWEFSAKTAFTFLPWFLRNTGADINYSRLASAVTSGLQDPLTGEVQMPPNESKHYINASLWYDDGKLNLRAAYQRRSARFTCITPCGGNNIDINYPGEGYTNVRLVGPGYNPGVPRFSDASTFIDLKAAYNITRNFQVYMEARNLLREAQTESTGKYLRFADDTPRVLRLTYGGRRLTGGVRIQFGGN